MEVMNFNRSGEKNGGVKLKALVGGGGGGGRALVAAATMWTFSEFRSSRKHSICKKGTLKKVKNGKNSGVDKSQNEKKNTSASNLLLDSETKSMLWTIDEEEEQIEESGSINGTHMVLLHKPDILPSESVHKKMHNFCHGVIDGVTCRKKEEEDVRFMTLNAIVDDGSNETVSKDIEYNGEDTSETRVTSDSSMESNTEAAPTLKSSDDGKLSSVRERWRWGSISKDQRMVQGSSTYLRIWVMTVLVALLVLLGAFIAQRQHN